VSFPGFTTGPFGLGALCGGINAELGNAPLITHCNARSVRSWLAQWETEGTVQARWAELDVLNIEVCYYLSCFSYTPRTICYPLAGLRLL